MSNYSRFELNHWVLFGLIFFLLTNGARVVVNCFREQHQQDAGPSKRIRGRNIKHSTKPLVGYRLFEGGWYRGKPILSSVFVNYMWHSPTSKPSRPWWDRKSGYYAFRRHWQARMHRNERRGLVLGKVVAWGSVIQGTTGFRAEVQQIVKLEPRVFCSECRRYAEYFVPQRIVWFCAKHYPNDPEHKRSITASEYFRMLGSRYGVEIAETRPFLTIRFLESSRLLAGKPRIFRVMFGILSICLPINLFWLLPHGP